MLIWVNLHSNFWESGGEKQKPSKIALLVHGGDRNFILDFLTLRPWALPIHVTVSRRQRARRLLL